MAQGRCEARRTMAAQGRRGACTETCAGAQAKYGGAAIGWAAARSVCSACECGTHGDEGLGGAVGPAIAAVHRRLCRVDRRVGWRGHAHDVARGRERAAPVVLKNST
jgi:hypothetical protein